MLHQCHCGGIVRFNGRFDGGQQAGATRLHNSRRPDFYDHRKAHRRFAYHRLHNPKWRSSVERLADKLRAGRRVGPSMLHQCHCGRIDSFIGLFGSAPGDSTTSGSPDIFVEGDLAGAPHGAEM